MLGRARTPLGKNQMSVSNGQQLNTNNTIKNLPRPWAHKTHALPTVERNIW